LDIEVFVVDDDSTDNTVKAASEIAKRDARVHVLRNRRRKGPSGARNTGLECARGEYVAFLDADDVWLPHHLQEAVDFLTRHQEIDGVCFNSEIREYNTGHTLGDWFGRMELFQALQKKDIGDGYYGLAVELHHALLQESFVHLQAVVLRRSSIEGVWFDEELLRGEDRDFVMQLSVVRNIQLAFKDVVTSVYHRHAGSVTASSVENSLATALSHIKLFNKYRVILPDSEQRQIARRFVRQRYVSASYCCRQLGRHWEAFGLCVRSCAYGVTWDQLKEGTKCVWLIAVNGVLKGRSSPI